MKTLFLFRHAKSSKDDPKLEDHKRPLNEQGFKQAPEMGKLMAKKDLLPDLILSSNAKRAKQTAELAIEHSGYKGKIEFKEELYKSSIKMLLEILKEVPEKYTRVMLVGHNPEFEEFAWELIEEPIEIRTANLVHIELPIKTWKECNDQLRGRLVGTYSSGKCD